MSELEKVVAALAQRVADLEERTKDDDEQFRLFGNRINQYSLDQDRSINSAVTLMRSRIENVLAEFGDTLVRNFKEAVVSHAVAQITSEQIAKAIASKVLVTRPAQRGEHVDAVVRQATPEELRSGNIKS